MRRQTLAITASLVLLCGCATVSVPDRADLDQLPVVKFGQPVPADGRYVLHFPAGVGIDTPVTFKGNLFEKETREILTATPRRDLYVHKNWMSHDRQTWVKAGEEIDLDVQVVLPGYEHPKPGYLLLELNERS